MMDTGDGWDGNGRELFEGCLKVVGYLFGYGVGVFEVG
jgi:hypothetical protein